MAALWAPAGAHAGWSPPRDVPQSGDAVSTVVATSGRGSDFIGFPGRGEEGVLARFPFGRVTSPATVQRTGFDGIGTFELSAAPGGRLAATWGWFDESDLDDDPDADPCCARAVAAVWPSRGRPYRKVLSPPGIDASAGEAAAGPRGVNLFAWNLGDAMHVTIERRGRFTDQVILRQRPSPPGAALVSDTDIDLSFRADGRALLSWIAPTENGVDVWTAISDRAGRFGTPEQVGEFKGRVFASPKLMTDARGGQVIVWAQSDDVLDEHTIFASARAPGKRFGPPRSVGPADVSYFQAASGPRGDAAVTWTRRIDHRAVVYVSRRPRGGAFDRPVRLTRERIDDETAIGVDGHGRTMALYAIRGRHGQVRARVAQPRRRFGRPTTVSRRSGERLGCFQPHLAVAPTGHAVGVWRCMGDRFNIDGAQGAAYDP